MRFVFFASDKAREQLLADAFLMGVKRHGHAGEVRALALDVDVENCDVAVFVGVKSRELLKRISRTGAHFAQLDKGYSRHKPNGRAGWEYWRVALDAHHPTARLMTQDSPDDRAKAFGWSLKPWRKEGPKRTVILAGSSGKYHDYYGLSNPTKYAANVVEELRAQTERTIIYRPKPSWRDAEPLTKAAYSRPPEVLSDLLPKAHALVTHGSNACFEAVMAGVPCIVLGEGVAKPISSTEIDEIERPRMASDTERWRWAANLAYWQFSEAEFASGFAWDFLGGQLHG